MDVGSEGIFHLVTLMSEQGLHSSMHVLSAPYLLYHALPYPASLPQFLKHVSGSAFVHVISLTSSALPFSGIASWPLRAEPWPHTITALMPSICEQAC